jgi:serralysin
MALDDKGGHGADDVLPDDRGLGGHGADDVFGTVGDDRLGAGAGHHHLHGGAGDDTVLYTGSSSDYQFSRFGNSIFVTGPNGRDTLVGIEHLEFGNGTRIDIATLSAQQATGPIMAVSRGGDDFSDLAERYSGPVKYLNNQFLGSDSREAVGGTSQNDFINLLGGDDACNSGDGDDVLDGGAGSNFLSGGSGHDVFFLDGRGGQTTWATITDWQSGEELSIWGWRPGVSTVTWSAHEGTAGYEGVTMHADLNGDGSVDTSVTWTSMTQTELPKAHEFDGLLWFV